MATSLVLIHGMGSFAPGWSGPVLDGLDQAAATHAYAAFIGRPPSTRVDRVELLYDPYFDATLDAWSALAKDAGGQPYLSLDWMQDLKNSSSFIGKYVLDVLQWVFLKPIQSQIITHMAAQLLAIKDFEHAHIVAHSLGTAVIQRTLQAIGSGAFGPAPGRIGSLHMVANVSRILEDSRTPVYGGASPSLVRPCAQPADEAYYLMQYYNYHHVIDPITLARAFQDPGPGWPGSHYLDVPVTYLPTRDPAKVHDFLNYLAAPEVHIPLLRAVFGPASVTPAEQALALAQSAGTFPFPPGAPVSTDLAVFLRTIADHPQLFT